MVHRVRKKGIGYGREAALGKGRTGNVVCMQGMQERNIKQDMVVVLDFHEFGFGDTDVSGQVGSGAGKRSSQVRPY